MAMNVWMTISVFVVVVMATTVIGSTASHEQKRDRSSRKCCATKAYQCLRNHKCFKKPIDYECGQPCKTTDTTSCRPTAGDDCCMIYKHCLVDCQLVSADREGDQLLYCYEVCSNSYPC
nr:conotoxin precursor con-ikot-ikot [Conus judaeus]UMA83368.1 conotoxin precursor con-ikot-ikot [Conus judaeus]UMA83690.1 conotoxin precursor con-ikot-ikot [Conus judaeus]DAZ86386.1 TPA_inf: conotoxin precursor Con-ikot-ikot [Conus judaeus]